MIFSGDPSRDDAPAGVAALRAEVYHPVGLGDDVEVVLDHDDRVAGVDQPVQHARQLLDVGHVQADGRLVEHVERVPDLARRVRAAPPASSPFGRTLDKLGHQLDALRLAAGERRALLAEREVAQPHVLQERQAVMDRRVRGEEIHRVVHAHQEHVADALVLEAHGERLGIEARAAAGLAGHLHVGQEGHLDPLDALSLARLAAPARRVEREARGRVAAHARLGHLRVEPAHLVPEADVGRRARARRLADRRLVDLENAADRLPAGDGAAAGQRQVMRDEG